MPMLYGSRWLSLAGPRSGSPKSTGVSAWGLSSWVSSAEELGRVSAPTPLLATITQFVPLLLEALQSVPNPEIGELLAEVALGARTGSLAFAENGRWSAGSINTTAFGEGDSAAVTGRKTDVLAGTEVDSFVVVARRADSDRRDRLGAYLVERADTEVVALKVIDPALGWPT